jgi:nucleotide-binding universal stress UspA family protein
MYINILVPTEGSELAGKAIQHGIALAKRIGAKITVLTVLAPFHTFTTDAQMIEDAGSVQSTHAEACRENPWRRRPRGASSGRRMRDCPDRG